MTSIRSRLVFWLIVPLSLVACAIAIETFLSAKRVSKKLHDETLLTVMLTISENVLASNGDILAEDILEVLTDTLGDQFFYHLAGPNNGFVTGYADLPPPDANIDLKPGIPVFYDSTYKGDPVRVVTRRQLISERELNGWITITTWQRTSRREALTYDLFGTSAIRLFVIIISAGLIVAAAVSFGLQSLTQLRQAIEKRSPYDLTPIKRSVPKELKDIVQSMNTLLARVARSKANRERFIGDAAHQLRNPIAALKTQAQSALSAQSAADMRDGLHHIVETTNTLSELVDHMLASVGANAFDPDNAEPVDLAAIVEQATRERASAALDKAQNLSLDISARPLTVQGHPILLREAITNLIDNAIKHTNGGSSIRVSLDPADQQPNVEVCVSDDGDTISPDEFLKLAQPFATGKTAGRGSGLGLAIAREVAKAHRGDIIVRPLPSREGKAIILTLPATQNHTSGTTGA